MKKKLVVFYNPNNIGEINLYGVIGEAFYLGARLLKDQSRAGSVELFGVAARNLEKGISTMEHADPQREQHLRMLHECYQRLCVESSFPTELRRAKLPHSWPYYIRRTVEIAEELKGYEKVEEGKNPSAPNLEERV